MYIHNIRSIYWTKKVTSEFELEFFKETVETLINFCFCFPSFLSRQRERLLAMRQDKGSINQRKVILKLLVCGNKVMF